MKLSAAFLLLATMVACSVADHAVSLAPSHEAITEAPKPGYVVGPSDQLQINVYGQADLSKEYTVSPDGELALPLIGQVHAAGRPVIELQEEIRLRLAEFLVKPQVTVAILQFRQRFAVLGEVQKPGSYALEKRTTVLEAISMGGGFTEKAAPNRTKVIRTYGGREETIDVPVGDIMRGGEQSRDVILQPNDKVIVPESFF